MDAINERFREVRGMLNLSQDEFAAAANRTRSEIKNIEYGKTSPKEEVIVSVCKAHNINPIWLRTGAGEPFVPLTRSEELAAIFEKVEVGDDAKSRLIRAMARLPDEAFPAFVQYLEKLHNTLSEE